MNSHYSLGFFGVAGQTADGTLLLPAQPAYTPPPTRPRSAGSWAHMIDATTTHGPPGDHPGIIGSAAATRARDLPPRPSSRSRVGAGFDRDSLPEQLELSTSMMSALQYEEEIAPATTGVGDAGDDPVASATDGVSASRCSHLAQVCIPHAKSLLAGALSILTCRPARHAWVLVGVCAASRQAGDHRGIRLAPRILCTETTQAAAGECSCAVPAGPRGPEPCIIGRWRPPHIGGRGTDCCRG